MGLPQLWTTIMAGHCEWLYRDHFIRWKPCKALQIYELAIIMEVLIFWYIKFLIDKVGNKLMKSYKMKCGSVVWIHRYSNEGSIIIVHSVIYCVSLIESISLSETLRICLCYRSALVLPGHWWNMTSTIFSSQICVFISKYINTVICGEQMNDEWAIWEE